MSAISKRYLILVLCLAFFGEALAQTTVPATPPASATPTTSAPAAASPTPEDATKAAQTTQTTPPASTPAPGTTAPGTVDPKTPVVQTYGEKDTICKRSLHHKTLAEIKESTVAKNEVVDKRRVDYLKDKIRAEPTNMTLIAGLAREFMRQGDYQKAGLLLWNQIDKLEQRDMVLLAQVHQKAKQTGELKKIAEIMIGRDAKSSVAYYYLAMAYDRRNPKERDLYKNNLLKSLELDPRNRDAINTLAEYYIEQNNLFEVRSLYADSLKVMKKDPQLTSQLCEAVSLDSLHSETKTICAEAMKVSPSVAENYVYMGISMKEQEKWDEAYKWFQSASEKFPESEFALICLAEAQMHKKDFVAVYQAYKSASEVDPASERALLGYAMSSAEIKKLPESVAAFKKLCSINKRYGMHLKKVILELRRSAQKAEVTDFEAVLRKCGGYY